MKHIFHALSAELNYTIDQNKSIQMNEKFMLYNECKA